MGISSEAQHRGTPEHWQGILGEYSLSGKSARGFCREKGIPPSQLYYYLRRARKAAEADGGFIEVVRESPCNLWLEAGNCRIYVKRGFDAELLRQVSEALR